MLIQREEDSDVGMSVGSFAACHFHTLNGNGGVEGLGQDEG